MAIYVREIATGVETKVNNVRVNGGEIVAEWQCAEPKVGGAFYKSNPWLVRTDRTQWHAERERACRVFELADGYELVGARQRKKAVPAPEEVKEQPAPEVKGAKVEKVKGKKEEQPTPMPEPMPEPEPEPMPEPMPEPEPEPMPAPKKKEEVKKEDNVDETAKAIADALRGLKPKQEQGAPIDEDKIRKIAREVAEEVVDEKGVAKQVVEVKMPDRPKVEIEGVVCDDFKDMLEDLQDGYYPYMYGAAGCGKSHTAEQLAKALGLKLYSQTTLQFAHDVRGYGDAGGNFVPTPFYHAFANGGLEFVDEFDRSMPEASVVINTALANGYYDFPVIGRVYAHPDFHFIAAGNTRMKGADEEYVTGQVQDASSRDRIVEYEMKYDHRIELQIARGDEEIVKFVEDVRQAINEVQIQHIVSYRATKYMVDKQGQRELSSILRRKTFAGLEPDEIRVIYGALKDKNNKWAKAMSKLF